MLICASIAIIGYIMLISTPRPHIQYGGTFLVAAGSFACPPVVMGISHFYSSPPFIFLISHRSHHHLIPIKLTPHPPYRLASKQHLPTLRTRHSLGSSNRHREYRRLHRNIHLYPHRRAALYHRTRDQFGYVGVVFGGYGDNDGVLCVGELGAGEWGKGCEAEAEGRGRRRRGRIGTRIGVGA